VGAPKRRQRHAIGGVIWATLLLGGLAVANVRGPDIWAQTDSAHTTPKPEAGTPAPKPPSDATEKPPANPLLREGAELVDRLGVFRLAGDRVLFVTSDTKQRIVGLENLNLERIVRTIADRPETIEWAVTGVATEYRGTNYLLIRRATLKNRSPVVGESLFRAPANSP